MKEWFVYAAIMAVVFGLILRSTTALGSAIGLLFSLPVYLGLGWVLAKFGYQRPRLRRNTAAASSPTSSDGAASATRSSRSSSSGTRARPAPTRRTSTGPSQHPRRTTKNRRR
jgi:hypothetical protein